MKPIIKKYALEMGGPKRIGIRWLKLGEKLEVSFDGKPVTVCSGKNALKKGKEVRLPGGSTLKVQWLKFKLFLSRNGEPLPGSAAHPTYRVQQAYVWLWVLGFSSLFDGLTSAPAEVTFRYCTLSLT